MLILACFITAVIALTGGHFIWAIWHDFEADGSCPYVALRRRALLAWLGLVLSMVVACALIFLEAQ